MTTSLRRLIAIGVWTAALGCGASSELITPPPPPQPPPSSPPAPTIAAVRPSSVAPGTVWEVKITGTNLGVGTRIEFARGTVDPLLAVTPVSASATEVVIRLTVAQQAAEAPFDVVATNASGQSATGPEMLIVDRVPADELIPDGTGAVTAVLASGSAFGVVAGGCVDGDIATPVRWSPSGAIEFLATPAELGCRVQPLRATDGIVFGRGEAADAGGAIATVSWAAGANFAAELNPLVAPPIGDRFTFDAAAANGTFLGHATDQSVSEGRRFPFAWTKATGWSQLARPAGFDNCLALDVNATGAIVGHCFKGRGASETAVHWANATASPTSLPLPGGATGSVAQGINDAGMIVGGAGQSAVRWTPSGATWNAELLPGPGGGALAYQVNDAGWVSGTVGAAPTRAALWSPSGALQLLGRLDVNRVCAPNAIAESAVAAAPIVAGKCFRPGTDYPLSRPVLWRP